MQIGLFHLMQSRDPATSAQSVLDAVREQIRLADEMGMDTAWLAEHHFSTYSMCPSPLLAAVWLAGTTRRIRLAPAVLVLPLYEPTRLVEEFGFADLVTGGRIDLGFGAGYQNYEFERFRIPLAEAFERSLEIIDIFEQALTRQEIEYAGKHYRIPRASLAASASRRPTIYSAGGLGHGAMFARRTLKRGYVQFAHSGTRPFSEVVAQRAAYDRVAEEEGLDPLGLPLGVVRFVYVTDSKEAARRAAEHLRYSHRVAAALRLDYAAFDGATPRDLPAQGEPDIEDIVREAVIGPPEHCVERLLAERRLARLSHYACMMAVGGMEHRDVISSMERFGSEVLPQVRRAMEQAPKEELASQTRKFRSGAAPRPVGP